MQVKIKSSDIAGLSRDLEGLRRLLANATTDPKFLNSVGALLVSRGKENLNEGGAGGQSYALLKAATRREKRRKGYSLKPLQRTGLMRRSLSHEAGSGNLHLTAIDVLKHHQYGAPRAGIPKREVYTIEREDTEDMQNILQRILKQNTPIK